MFNFNRDSSSSYRRKLIKKNFIDGKPPFIFEVGKMASRSIPELGEVCAIKQAIQDGGSVKKYFYKIFIENAEGEQSLWKDVFDDEIIEYDVEH